MTDIFHESLSNQEIAAVFGVMAACPQHTFQLLTKRAKRMREWFTWLEESVERDAVEWSGRDCGTSIHAARTDCLLDYLDDTACAELAGHYDCCHLGLTTNDARTWPLSNVHLGVSTENQAAADERIPDLLGTPAALHWISAEPLFGPVILQGDDPQPAMRSRSYLRGLLGDRRIGWVVTGAESGPGSRPCDLAWVHSLRDQCAAADIPFFVKQLVADGKLRKDIDEFPEDLRIQEFPKVSP